MVFFIIFTELQSRVGCEDGHLLDGDLVEAFEAFVLREFFGDEQGVEVFQVGEVVPNVQTGNSVFLACLFPYPAA